MTYPKLQKHKEQKDVCEQEFRTAAKHYIESSSYEEFKIKLAAEGIFGKKGMSFAESAFKTYYFLHNTDDGQSRAGAMALMFSLLIVFGVSVVVGLILWLCDVQHLFLWLLPAIILIPLVYVFISSWYEIVEKTVSDTIDTVRRMS